MYVRACTLCLRALRSVLHVHGIERQPRRERKGLERKKRRREDRERERKRKKEREREREERERERER